MKPTLLILAAGIGSRYGSLKQIDGLGPHGETIIDYSVYDAIRAGFGKVVFVIRKSIEQEFKDSFSGKFSSQIEVDYVLQEIEYVPVGLSYTPERVKPWGTGQAVLVAHDAIKEPFAMINADDFYGKEAFETMANYLVSLDITQPTFCMVGYKLENTLSEHGFVSRGVCVSDENNYLLTVTERTKIGVSGDHIVYQEGETEVILPGDTIVSMNMFGFTPALFPLAEEYFTSFIRENGFNPKSEFYVPSILSRMINEGRGSVKVLSSDATWFGVTYKEDRPIVVGKIRDLVAKGDYPEKLWV
ncbi:MAG: sugar phosphate nucleotidyltransferase [Bacteroidia bacterium]|nr:sugar phosphate nucleotidyltransferase [Bacteroidia bacterium]